MSEIDPFVLIHGGWHGGWVWQRVARILRARGHDVYTPSLTGLGDRSHLLTEAVSVDTHTEDVVALLRYEGLNNVTLVGHSYGGMVIAAVAGRVPERIHRLVFLDAFLPETGKSLNDYAPVPPVPDGVWRIPPLGQADSFGITDHDDAAWVDDRLCDQPLKTFTQPVQDYIRCTDAPWFMGAASRAERLGFKMHMVPNAGHDAMITHPEAVVQRLLRRGGRSENGPLRKAWRRNWARQR